MRRYTHIYLSEAQEEYEKAVAWYMERSQAAAENYVSHIEATIQLICTNPYGWRNIRGSYFEINVKQFPYSIVYQVDHERSLVLITAIHHHRDNPDKKYK